MTTCNLCPEIEPNYRIVTDDHKHLTICDDCVRRFGVDEWRSIENLTTGVFKTNNLY